MKPVSKYERIRQVLSEMKQPSYRYSQITEAIFKGKVGEFERMVILPKSLREQLIQTLGPRVCSILPVKELTSSQVSKVLFAVAGDEHIEAVRLHYERRWKSYCISAQCGCGFGCKFCAKAVAELLRGRGPGEHLYHVNLIPYNSTGVTPEGYRTSDSNQIESFVRVLKSKGIKVSIRTQFGSDINAACGQLYGKE